MFNPYSLLYKEGGFHTSIYLSNTQITSICFIVKIKTQLDLNEDRNTIWILKGFVKYMLKINVTSLYQLSHRLGVPKHLKYQVLKANAGVDSPGKIALPLRPPPPLSTFIAASIRIIFSFRIHLCIRLCKAFRIPSLRI